MIKPRIYILLVESIAGKHLPAVGKIWGFNWIAIFIWASSEIGG